MAGRNVEVCLHVRGAHVRLRVVGAVIHVMQPLSRGYGPCGGMEQGLEHQCAGPDYLEVAWHHTVLMTFA